MNEKKLNGELETIEKKVDCLERKINNLDEKFENFKSNHFHGLSEKVRNLVDRFTECEVKINFLKGRASVTLPLLIAICGALGWLAKVIIDLCLIVQ